LENIRINEAKKLLEQGVPPVDAALQTGFSDQSHFTNFFNMFIGLAPGIYRDIFIKNTDGGWKNNGKK
jgi:transcriptional regulator GlxA family with amidase domain